MVLVETFSGVRGEFGKDLTIEVCKNYAIAFSKFYAGKGITFPKIVIGIDTRVSGTAIKKAMIESFSGNIIDVGVMPTAGVENAVREYNADGGIMITGSHNEPKDNGLKFLDSNGAILPPLDAEKLIEYAHLSSPFTNTTIPTTIKPNIELMGEDCLKKYFDFALSFF